MKSEQIKKITSKAIWQLIAPLNEGGSETLTTYLTAMARLRRYSLRTVIVITSIPPSRQREDPEPTPNHARIRDVGA